jgi:hypothetical protein
MANPYRENVSAGFCDTMPFKISSRLLMLCYYTSEMSCPYFYPTESRGGGALLPLGDSWTGQCRANSSAPIARADTLSCNLGYARGQCERFPDDAGPDAVRFTIARHEPAALHLYYVIERDHHPYAHGPMEYSFQTGFTATVDPTLERQAAAYIESYQRRKRQA